MSALLFVGPSFPALHRSRLHGIEVRPPAAQGDVLRAVREGARLIGLVDGVFGSEPAVWHKELLFALECGVRTLGAASMGALRAAELHAFGMEGVGTIFAAYRDGVLVADDEVALVHGPAELGWVALSEPMVNLRATLARLARTGLLTAEEATRVARRSAALFYPERTRAAFEAILRETVGDARGETVVRWARRLFVDAKRADAARLVRRLTALATVPSEPPPVRFALSRSAPWRAVLRATGPATTPVSDRRPSMQSPTLPAEPLAPRPWAVFGLIAADNNLADELREDLAELLRAPGLDRLHVAGEADSRDTELCGRFALVPARTTASGPSASRLVIERRGPRNTGDRALLEGLLQWALPTFPADRRVLLFWGHGEGLRLAIDDGAADALTIPELVAALESGRAHGRFVDLVIFDACLMAKLELLADLAPYARFVLASGEVVPASGLPYHRVVGVLAEADCPERAARALIPHFLEDAAARGQWHARLALARTAGAETALAAVARAAERLRTLLPVARARILETRLLARSARAGELVDVVDMLERLARGLRDPSLEVLVEVAIDAIDRILVCARSLRSSAERERGGLNIWFPTQAQLFARGRAEYASRPSIRGPGAGWLAFLDAFHRCASGDFRHNEKTRLALSATSPP